MTDKTPEDLASEYDYPKMTTLAVRLHTYAARRDDKSLVAISECIEDAINSGYLAGYAAALPKWIKVSERLPEVNKEVLAISSSGFMMVTCMVPDETWTDPEENDYEQKRYVNIFTHWMPLPEPPKDL